MFKRIPTVFSLEYLRVFLNVVKKEGYDLKAIRNAIFNQRVKFEREKFKAIGKGYRLKTVKSERLAENCYRLFVQTELLRRAGNEVLLSEEATEFLDHDITYPKTKSMLLGRLLKTYIPFNEVLLRIRNQTKGEFLLPLGKETVLFKSLAEGYQLKVDKIQFEVVRDLLTQLEILNWREKKNGQRMQRVYLIANVLKLSEILASIKQPSELTDIENLPVDRFVREVSDGGVFPIEGKSPTDILRQAENNGYILIRLEEEEDFLLIRTFTVSSGDFEVVLWKEYLKLSDYKSNYPVYYSELRDYVCEQLRISDKTFDSFIKRMINKPDEYAVKLHPGGGPLPPRRGLSSMLKVLPPKTGSDEYITFIKATK
ncbi:MAG TPA: hypothetical protein VJ249_02315 [Candidatus Bathyarchaeia archaeon]|nr:hypothetical protein [Candidatus Bathyarchaeia archaeon]